MYPAEAVAAIEAMQRYDLSVSYWWGLGWTCTSRTDVYDPTSDAQPPRFESVIEAVADWMLRHQKPWPVMMSETV